MNPTPSQSERPEPPEGYRLLTDEEKPLPDGAMCYWNDTVKWTLSGRVGRVPSRAFIYAVPIATRTAPEAVAGEPVCNCAGGDDGAWGLASHTSNCATQSTPPPDKDAEIAALKDERDGALHRDAMSHGLLRASSKTINRLTKESANKEATIKALGESREKLKSDLLAANQRIEALEWALSAAKGVLDTSTPTWPARHRAAQALVNKALAHAAEVGTKGDK